MKKETEDSLTLVLQQSVSMSGWLQTKLLNKMLVAHYDEHWCEIRGSWLLVSRPTDKKKKGNSTASSAYDNSTVYQCNGARLIFNDKKLQAMVKPPGCKGVAIKFKGDQRADYEVWQTSFRSAASFKREMRLSDFEVLKKLGKGGCGKVYLAKEKAEGELYALKVLEKSSMGKVFRKQHVVDERQILEICDAHPFILRLFYAFQTTNRLYMVTEFCAGGDLYKYLVSLGRPLPERRAKRLAAEIILGLEYLHETGTIYRDLKLENIFIDTDGHVRLADFGLSKILRHETTDRKFRGANSFCGTREYIAPEMLRDDEYGQAIDMWSLGVAIYEVVSGRTPFPAKTEEDMFAKIQRGAIHYPKGFSDDLVYLLQGLFQVNPKHRLGCKHGFQELKDHAWFEDVNWEDIYNKVPHKDSLAVNPKMLKIDGKDADIRFSDLDDSKRKLLERFGVSQTKQGQSVAGFSFCSKSSNSFALCTSEVGIYQDEDEDLQMPPSFASLNQSGVLF
mmetsp:Transcript_5518/g.16475  ORF Transcript_5518/g.16475 Transcript_5518/m.16475 type:complete len:505 (+) Transcript_5518:435-1949(+)